MGRRDTPPPPSRHLGGLVVLIAAWAVASLAVFVAFTQMFGAGSDIPLIVKAQSLTPYLLPLGVPAFVVGLLRRSRALMGASAVAVIAFVVLAAPLVWHPDPPQVDPDAPTLSVLHVNAYWNSDDKVRAADAILDAHADVLAISELTPALAEDLDALGADEDYPYRVGEAQDETEGIALWSRYPLTDAVMEPVGERLGVHAVVEVEGRELRVIVVHPIPPLTPDGRAAWIPSLEAINALARAGDTPTLLVGDLNASWWHPPYRRALSDGLVDVHRVLGDGFSVSWPANRRWMPVFTRLDHALVDDNVQPLGIDDLHVPGSDHEGFVVRVAVGLPTSEE